MKNRNKIVILSTAIVLAIAVFIVAYFYFGGAERKYKHNLDLGQKFLQELNYEEAIANFEKAIDIDPMKADAYIGMADAYVGIGDIESAKNILEKAINVFEDNGLDLKLLLEKLDEVEKIIAEKEEVYIDLRPIINILENFNGKSWLRWTADELIDEFGLTLEERGDNYSYYIDYDSFNLKVVLEKYTDFYKWDDGRFGMSINTLVGFNSDGEAVYGVPLSFVHDDNSIWLFQEISCVNNDIINSYFAPLFLKVGVSNVKSLLEYWGIEKDYSGMINTDYGYAEIFIDDSYIMISMEGFEGYNDLEISFYESEFGDEFDAFNIDVTINY